MKTTRYLKRIDSTELDRERRSPVPSEILKAAAPIVERVRTEGEAALREFAGRFDDLPANRPVRIERPELEGAFDALLAADRELLERSAERIRTFARAQRNCLRDLEVENSGLRMGHRVTPVPVAGCYAPGGRFPLPSTVLMTAITAREAGVDEVVVASPRPAPVTLAAAAVAGADALVAVGGAHAIAAMAYGTESTPACDVIVGPGNAWVTAAKQIVAGEVRIDSLAGPSELLAVVDRETNPALVASDLLAQAEHDPLAVPSLIALDEGCIDAIESELDRQLVDLSTAETARAALGNGFVIVVEDANEAARLCNEFAPEHLQWMAADRDPVASLIHFGGLFIGEGAAEVLGDYGAGPNHVLPTGGTARSRGGLSVLDFVKVSTWMEATETGDSELVAHDAAQLADLEGLAGHARAARQRLRKR
jgi:phosphoribosyl-ATP pyrophosphohydrolase/phosphoribosyl-AMP cyclohydrolase/histidinol dehydrogenase